MQWSIRAFHYWLIVTIDIIASNSFILEGW